MTPATQRPHVALIVCGALAADVRSILEQRGWPADVYGVPGSHHMHPSKIVTAVDELLERIGDRYGKVIVVYGDCGTAGELDRVLQRHGVQRTAGAHCYEMFCGALFTEVAERHPTSYFLTDYLVRHWDGVVMREMGLDKAPEAKAKLFAGFTSVTYLRQTTDPELLRQGQRIAAYLGLPLSVEEVGRTALEAELDRLLRDGSSR